MSEVADGPETNVTGRRSSAQVAGESAHRGRERRPRPGGLDDAEVEVRHEREGAAALPRAGVEDDRPGLGDRERAAGHRAVHLVELADAEPRVGNRTRPPAGATSAADPQGRRRAARRARGTRPRSPRSPVRRDDPDAGAVVRDPLQEALDGSRRPRAPDSPRLTCASSGSSASGTSASARLIRARISFRARSSRVPPLAERLPARRGGRSRVVVQAPRPGSRLMRPPRANGRPASRPSRCASRNRRSEAKTHASTRMACRSARDGGASATTRRGGGRAPPGCRS